MLKKERMQTFFLLMCIAHTYICVLHLLFLAVFYGWLLSIWKKYSSRKKHFFSCGKKPPAGNLKYKGDNRKYV